ncbi:ATP-dependent DNA ligase, partial [Patescibacteria group bacterium]|nr:ATP-dependent DNA ligase [Patescibacteria group bacterium]MBU1457098.1 ATP-dependent DNA ligase [Patescibacteria group bacterium]
VVRAVAKATGKEADEVMESYKTKGDLGEVIKVILNQVQDDGGENLTILEVHKKLKEIAEDGGEGSQDRKVVALAELLGRVDSVGAKFAVRIVLDKLRLGFSTKTVLDALSVMEVGDKSLRKRLDSLDQIHPDLGLLVKKIKEGGVEKAEREIEVEVGVPVESALCQRLNSAKEIIEKMGRVGVEKKFDGSRTQIHFTNGILRAFTRNLEESSHQFPELKDMHKWVKAKSLILDAEAVGVDPKTGKMLPFQETITRKRKHGIEDAASKVPLKFFVFDILYKNGKSLLDKTYEERRKILTTTVRKNNVLVVDEVVVTEKTGEVHKLHEDFLKEGLEGAVVKKMDGRYLPGRQGWGWVKIKESEGETGKLTDTLDLVVMGFNRGKGKRASFGVGAFLGGVRKGEKILTLAKVGTGLTDEQFGELKKRLDKLVVVEKPKVYEVLKILEPDVWVEPGLVVEVAADEITKSPSHTAGVALRFPRLVRFRDDKRVDQATSAEELHGIKVA